jgi:hypothetical protein
MGGDVAASFPELGTWNLELGTWNLELGTWNLELGTWNLTHELVFVAR